MRGARPLAIALALAAPPAGCGDQFIDSGRAEGEIRERIESQTGLSLAAVECPEDVKAREGDTFRCTARGAGGGEATVNVRQTDEDGTVEFSVPDLSGLR